MAVLSLIPSPGLPPFDPLGSLLRVLRGSDGFGSCRIKDGWSCYQIEINLPGFIKDDIQVYIRNQKLVVNALSSNCFRENKIQSIS